MEKDYLRCWEIRLASCDRVYIEATNWTVSSAGDLILMRGEYNIEGYAAGQWLGVSPYDDADEEVEEEIEEVEREFVEIDDL